MDAIGRTTLLLVAGNLLLRLALLEWNVAELSDSFEMVIKEPLGGGKRLPLYPALLRAAAWVVGDRLVAGKLVSMLAGALTVVPVVRLASRGYGARAGVVAGLLYSVSALPLRWSIRVMTEATFTCALLFAAVALLTAWTDRRPRDAALAGLFTGLALLTRPEAAVLLPLLVVVWFRTLRAHRLVAAWSLLPGAAMFGLLGWWLFGVVGHFAYGSVVGHGATVGRTLGYLGGYAGLLAHVVTPPVALAAAVTLLRRRNEDRALRFGLGWVLLGTLLGVSLSWAFSGRHIAQLPPLVAVLAAPTFVALLDARHVLGRGVLVATLVLSVVFSVWALAGSRHTFADFRAVAEAARVHPRERPLLTDDKWFKTAWYLGEPIHTYDRRRVAPGRLVALHSLYTRLERELSWLRSRYEVEVVSTSVVHTRPLLGDDVWAAGIAKTHRQSKGPRDLFSEQRFESVLLRIGRPLK